MGILDTIQGIGSGVASKVDEWEESVETWTDTLSNGNGSSPETEYESRNVVTVSEDPFLDVQTPAHVDSPSIFEEYPWLLPGLGVGVFIIILARAK